MKSMRGFLLIILLAVFTVLLAEHVKAGEGRITWAPVGATLDHAVLTVSGPGDVYFQKSFEAGTVPCFPSVDESGVPFPDGTYKYELRKVPYVSPEVRKALVSARETGDRSLIEELEDSGTLSEKYSVESGHFAIQSGSIITGDIPEPPTTNDVLHYDDVIVTGSLCVGFDCANGESFGFDTIRLKENNLRIKFQDTSTSASYPTNDWQITANDSTNGGLNKFSIDDIDAGRTPFTIEAGTRANALYVDDSGRVGLGTSTPAEDLHIWYGDTPTIRLAQSGGGWAPQTWDIAGNEASFFIRDVTNSSKLPFRIQPSTPNSTLCLKSDGKVGIGTWSPTATLHVEGDAYIKTSLEIGSSRELKENINDLTLNAALGALKELKPVRFNYKSKPEEQLGFISEDVPDLVATNSRKSINTMDIVAVLTRVVQEQQEVIKKQQKDISRLYRFVEELEQGIKLSNRSQPENTGIGSHQPNAQASSFTEFRSTAEREGAI
jgi:hypothetical protein